MRAVFCDPGCHAEQECRGPPRAPLRTYAANNQATKLEEHAPPS